MSVWDPWDADEEELADLRVVRDRIPVTMRPALLDWVNKRLVGPYNSTASEVVNALQSGLRIHFGFDRGFVDTDILVDAIERQGDKTLLRVVDWLLGQFEKPTNPYYGEPAEVTDLEWHLDTAMSGVRVVSDAGVYRLGRRLPEGVEEAAQIAVDGGSKVAGEHLAKALRHVQSLEPDTSAAMTEAIKAVEAAAGPVVLPNSKRHRLSMIVQALKDKSDWTLVLERRDDGYPDHQAVLIGMIETLVFAQRDRHAGGPSSPQQAMAHAMLAATLVGWFSTGVVEMNDR
ncbi:hypothetical protein [Glaciibacter sp. 2TAF33]|uniref:hypothetical protein n=1 Tax=Glaciibacter sp. 2TAF33 TaxID=3233015 RepID=UPI003F9185F5